MVGAPRFELGTSWSRSWRSRGMSLILRHGWQRKSTQKHGKNAQVVPIWYSFGRSLGGANLGEQNVI
jgi:hypothetical protein